MTDNDTNDIRRKALLLVEAIDLAAGMIAAGATDKQISVQLSAPMHDVRMIRAGIQSGFL